MNVTVNQIRQEMTTLVQAHEMVNSFFWGDFHRSYNEQTPLYPLVCSYLTYNTMLDNMSNDNLVIIICDKTYKDYSNLNDTESDTKQVARHLFNVIRQSPRWNDLLRVNSATMSKFIDDTSDEVAGVILTLNVNLKSSRSLCDLPLDNYSFDGDFEGETCDPVLIVNSNQTFTFSAASGTIVELSDTPVLVTDLEGNPLGSGDLPSVTGGTIQVNITPTPCDPSDVFINGVEIGTTTNGEQFDITVEQGGVEVGSFVDGVWVVPECAPCEDATAVLVDTATPTPNTISTTPIASGASANIVAPDGTVTVNRDGVFFATQAVRSNGTETINVPSDCPVVNPVGGMLPYKSGQTTVYVTGDDGTTQRGQVFFTLPFNNPWGNTTRFLDTLGGTTFANGITLDTATTRYTTPTTGIIMGYFFVDISSNFGNQVNAAGIATHGGFSGFRIINDRELYSLSIQSGSANNSLNHSGLLAPDNILIHTGTTNPNSTTQNMQRNAGGIVTSASKNNNGRRIDARIFSFTISGLTVILS